MRGDDKVFLLPRKSFTYRCIEKNNVKGELPAGGSDDNVLKGNCPCQPLFKHTFETAFGPVLRGFHPTEAISVLFAERNKV
jgi:hypothetical protein